jgi:hypothetical protein
MQNSGHQNANRWHMHYTRTNIDMIHHTTSGQIEIWTTAKMAKNGDKSGNFNNFPVQATKKLTQSGRNRDRLSLKGIVSSDVPN